MMAQPLKTEINSEPQSNKKRVLFTMLGILGALLALWLRYSLRLHETNDFLCCYKVW